MNRDQTRDQRDQRDQTTAGNAGGRCPLYSKGARRVGVGGIPGPRPGPPPPQPPPQPGPEGGHRTRAGRVTRAGGPWGPAGRNQPQRRPGSAGGAWGAVDVAVFGAESDFTIKIRDLLIALKVGRKSLFLNDCHFDKSGQILGVFGLKIQNFDPPLFKRFFKGQAENKAPLFKRFFDEGLKPNYIGPDPHIQNVIKNVINRAW